MTPEALRSLARVHGVLAWVSVAALAIAVVAVWRRRASGALLGALAAGIGAATFATGAALHGPFQAKLRQRLFLASAALGWLFERKEHAVFGALALSICGALALGAERLSGGGGGARDLRRAGIVALGCALALEVFALGVSIAAARRVAF